VGLYRDYVIPTDLVSPDLVSTELVSTNGKSTMSVKTAVEISKVLQPVQAGLALVETKMKSVESSLFAPLADAFVDLIGSGGKRLRPTLALLASQVRADQSMSSTFPQIVALAASVEMLHTATLVHDDVIDGALLRRGAPTLNALWNRGTTILAGNFMFARAAHFAAETGNLRVIHIFADTLETIVNGEMHQLFARHDFYQDKEGYYQRIYAKTASLFCAATEAAAVLAGLDESEVQALRSYGYNLGMAFQIVDDILDFTGNDATLGKPAGSDLRGGTVTLPFFYYLQRHPEAEALINRLQDAHAAASEGDSLPWDALVTQVVRELRTSNAVESALREAHDFLDLARANVAGLPDSPYHRSMLELCDFVVQRTY
jgi:geranylgeranyl pyrophosphate synthase